MRVPIRYQFMIPLMGVAAASLVAVGLVTARLATTGTTERIEQQLRGVVSVLSASSYPLTDSVLRQMAGLAHAEFLLTDVAGRRIASSSDLELPGIGARQPVGEPGEGVRLGGEVVVGSTPMLHSAVRLDRRSAPSDPRVLHVFFAKDEYAAAWRAAFVPPLAVGAATVIAIAVASHVVAGRIAATLGRLGKEVSRLADGDFSEVTVPAWDDETRDLALAVNQTAARLTGYETELRQSERLRTVSMLGAGLAHELRNAATGCRLAVDLHEERCCAEGADDSLGVARRQLGLMENRLRQLLQFGRAPADGTPTELVDLARLVTESLGLVAPAARHARVRLDWVAPTDPVQVSGNADMLGQAITNVLINALDAAKAGKAAGHAEGAVAVELRRDSGGAELLVTDSGDGPACDAVFQPFVTTKSEGVGLGLAVAKRVVEEFGGRIDWARVGDATRFRFLFPPVGAQQSNG